MVLTSVELVNCWSYCACFWTLTAQWCWQGVAFPEKALQHSGSNNSPVYRGKYPLLQYNIYVVTKRQHGCLVPLACQTLYRIVTITKIAHIRSIACHGATWNWHGIAIQVGLCVCSHMVCVYIYCIVCKGEAQSHNSPYPTSLSSWRQVLGDQRKTFLTLQVSCAW